MFSSLLTSHKVNLFTISFYFILKFISTVSLIWQHDLQASFCELANGYNCLFGKRAANMNALWKSTSCTEKEACQGSSEGQPTCTILFGFVCVPLAFLLQYAPRHFIAMAILWNWKKFADKPQGSLSKKGKTFCLIFCHKQAQFTINKFNWMIDVISNK